MITRMVKCDGKGCTATFGEDKHFVHTSYVREAARLAGWAVVSVGRPPRTVELCSACFAQISELTQSAAAEVVEAPRLIDTVLVTRSNRLGKGNDGK